MIFIGLSLLSIGRKFFGKPKSLIGFSCDAPLGNRSYVDQKINPSDVDKNGQINVATFPG
jgi:hypothetical protein